MARLELGLVTSLRFATRIDEASADLVSQSIAFAGRLFVWHDPDFDHDPALTVLHADTATERSAAAEDAQRLLSGLSYAFETAIETVITGGSGETDAWWRPHVSTPRSSYGLVVMRAPATVSIVQERRARQAIALCREALGARSPFYRFLALWNALDVALPDASRRRSYLDTRTPHAWSIHRQSDPVPPRPSEYFWESSRNAVAHAVRASRPEVDPDVPGDRARLRDDAHVLLPLVRTAIEAAWPNVVVVTHPE